MKKPYNITELNVLNAIEKGIVHRDYAAHLFRFSHILKIAKIGMNVLDFGCGSGNLAEVLYRNMYKGKEYLGLDIRKKTIESNREKFSKVDWIYFAECDLVKTETTYNPRQGEWDIITSFEVAEHIGKNNVPKFLDNIKRHMGAETKLLISTPCYDEKVGAAGNHTYDSGDGLGIQQQELTFAQMKELLDSRFLIQNVWGTFASQKDYKFYMSKSQDDVFESLSKYYDSNLLSVIMAPMFPERSRNCIWECTL